MQLKNSIAGLVPFLMHPDRRNFIIYSIGAFFLKGISFFLIPLYTNLLSTTEMGHFDLLRNFGSITEIILSLGLLQLIFAEFYDPGVKSKTRLVASYLSIYITCATPLYILLTVLLAFSGDAFLPGIKPLLIYIVLLTTYLNFFQVMLISVLKLSFKALRVSLLQVILGTTTLILNVVLVYGLKKGIDGIIISGLIIAILACIYGLIYFRKNLYALRLPFSIPEARKYLKFSLPFIPNVLAFWLMNSANRWILLYYSGAAEVGIYAVAMRLTAVMEPLLIEPFLSAYVPSVLKSFRDKNFDQKFLTRYLIIPFVFLGIGFLIRIFGGIVVGSAFDSALPLIIPLSLAYGMNLLAQSSSVILQFHKKISIMLLCVMVGSITGIAVNFLTVPDMGSMGAALAAICGNFAWALLITIFALNQLEKAKKLQV